MKKFDLNSLVRSSILNLKPYSSARDEYTDTGAAVFLDANENPFDNEGRPNRYPDPYQKDLKKKISEIKSVPAENIFLGNGSDEAIDLLFRIFCRPGIDEVISIKPSYGMYQVSADINDIAVKMVELDKDFQLCVPSILEACNSLTKMIFLCSPNNPTGNSLNREKVKEVLEQFNGLVIVDEAYVDFGGESWTNELSAYPNLIVLQTFSKAWGMAAIRLGMAFASEEIILLFNKTKPPYNVNGLTQQYALEALQNQDQYKKELAQVIQERDRMTTFLKSLSFIQKVFPSDANFILCQTDIACELYESLIQKGIVVRLRKGMPYYGDCIRISVGTPEENEELMTKLKSCNTQPSGSYVAW